MVIELRFKITHIKTPTNAILALKIGQTVLTLKQTHYLSKIPQSTIVTTTNQTMNSRFEEQWINQIEAEQKRNQGRTYASVMPIR